MTDSDNGLVTKVSRTLLPLWLSYPLVLLGMWFLLLPVAVAMGTEWQYYGVGVVGGVVFSLLALRWFKMTVLERGPGFWVYRLEFLPKLRQSAPEAETTADTT